jgi:hypothetical protein
MAVASHLRFRMAAPLLAVATAMVAPLRARPVGAELFASSWKASHTLQAHLTQSGPGICKIVRAKLPPHDALEPRALPFGPTRPVILDGVMYLETGSQSGTGGSHSAALSRCSIHSKTREFGVIHRHIDSPRYY